MSKPAMYGGPPMAGALPHGWTPPYPSRRYPAAPSAMPPESCDVTTKERAMSQPQYAGVGAGGAAPHAWIAPKPSSVQPPEPSVRAWTARAMSHPAQYGAPLILTAVLPKACKPPKPSRLTPPDGLPAAAAIAAAAAPCGWGGARLC